MARPDPTEIKDIWASGDRLGALGRAAKVRTPPAYRDRIARGWAAHQHPDTYREMGYDPEALVSDGIEAVRECFQLGE